MIHRDSHIWPPHCARILTSIITVLVNMYNKQSLFPKRRQSSNLRSDRGVKNITVLDMVFYGMLLRCLSDSVTEGLIKKCNVATTVSLSKTVLRSSHWTELIFYNFYVST